MNRIGKLALVSAGIAFAATACGSSSTGAGGAAGVSHWATATSAEAGGGMSALIAAAKAEGSLNVIALPADWANYGTIMKDFTAKYGIKINDADPSGSSGDEINAIQRDQHLPSAPDVIDVGNSHAVPNTALFAPYKVATWNAIPAALKDPSGKWYGDYGGYITIGCVAADVAPAPCPTSFAGLANPAYRADYQGKISIDGDPTAAQAAFSAVWAAALADGGSLSDIGPGIGFFAKLKADGLFNATQDSESTIQQGSTPITIDWEFNNLQYASSLKSKGIDFTVRIPTDALVSAYYDQAINKDAPHPAAARLWEEYLYSAIGQNDFIGGFAVPVEYSAMQASGTLDAAAAAGLPKASGTAQFPTLAQQTAAQNELTQNWAAQMG